MKSVVLPVLIHEPAVYMSILYTSSALLSSVKSEGESRLAKAIKKEAIRQINIRLNDKRIANTSETISALAFLSTGVWVGLRLHVGSWIQ